VVGAIGSYQLYWKMEAVGFGEGTVEYPAFVVWHTVVLPCDVLVYDCCFW